MRCHNLRKINYVPAKLQCLEILYCRELEELPGVVETLVSLDVTGCVKLKSIRELGKLTKLRDLSVSGCSELEEVEGIQDCMSLLMLVARECPKLQWSAGVVEQLRQRLKCFYV